jgi:vitamin B12 transporter
MINRVAVAWLVLLPPLSVAWAQQTPPSFGGTVVVTATDDAFAATQTDAATTVIDGAELEASGVLSLSDLLRRVPGTELLRSGGNNGVTTLFVRGTNSNQTLVLFDGVRLNSPFFGGYDWSIPLTAGVGRVEIVRGPYSALYGSDALGGVVQIFPATTEGSSFRSLVEEGPDGWLRGEVEGAIHSGPLHVTLAGGWREGSGPLANDDFRSGSGLLDVSVDLAQGLRLGGLFHRTTSFTGIPFSGALATPHRSTSEVETVTALPLHANLGGTSELEVVLSHVGRTLDFRDPDDSQGFTSESTEANSDGLRVALHQTAGDHRLVVGSEWRRDEVTDGSSYGANLDHRRLDTRSLFVQDSVPLGAGLALLAGARWDEADPWGGEVSPRATLSWRGTHVCAWLSVGRAFRAPSLGELYYPYSGNVLLRPERARSGELGVALPVGGVSAVQLVGFSNRVSDLIDFDYATYRYDNIAHAAQDGLEASYVRRDRGGRTLRLSVTWLDARDGDGQPLLRRARWTGSATLDSPLFLSASGELSIVWVGARPDLDPVTFARVDQGGFVTADLALRAPLGSGVALRLRVVNLADRAYQEVRGYPAPGRRIMAGVEFGLH